MVLGDLLQDKVVLNLQEGGEGPLPGDPCPQVAVAVVETRQDIEYQDSVLHRPAEVVKSIGHALHPPAVLADREVPLREVAEGRIELESAGLGVAEELTLERQPNLTRGATVGPDDVLEVEGEGPEDPGQGDAVETLPRRGLSRDRHVKEDVVIQGVALEGEEDQVPQSSVGRRRGVEDDRD